MSSYFPSIDELMHQVKGQHRVSKLMKSYLPENMQSTDAWINCRQRRITTRNYKYVEKSSQNDTAN